MQEYSFLKTIKKMCKEAVIFGLPIVVNEFLLHYPTYDALTVGALLRGAVNWFEHSVVPRLFR